MTVEVKRRVSVNLIKLSVKFQNKENTSKAKNTILNRGESNYRYNEKNQDWCVLYVHMAAFHRIYDIFQIDEN